MSHSMIEFVFTCKYFHLKPPLIAQLCKLDYSMQQFTWVSTTLHPPPRLFFLPPPTAFFCTAKGIFLPGLLLFFAKQKRQSPPRCGGQSPPRQKKAKQPLRLGFASFFAGAASPGQSPYPGKKSGAKKSGGKKMSKQPWQ